MTVVRFWLSIIIGVAAVVTGIEGAGIDSWLASCAGAWIIGTAFGYESA